MPQTPKVFISYSWDGKEHQDWVLKLADRLTEEGGVEVMLDQYELNSGRNLNHFMERAVAEADKVLLILTENYKRKAENREGGIGFEYSMITTEWFKNQTGKVKFIPVLRGQDRDNSTPNFVQSFLSLNMQNDADFDEEFRKLLFDVYDEQIVKPPKRGTRPNFDAMRQERTAAQPSPTPANTRNEIEAEREKYAKEKAARTLQTKVRNFIAKDKTGDALQAISEYADLTEDNDLQNEIVLQSARQASLDRDRRMGTISNERENIEGNRIIQAVLQMMQSVVKNLG